MLSYLYTEIIMPIMKNPYKARHYQVGGEVNPYQRAPLESLVGITPSARPEYRAIHEGGQAPIDTQYVGDLERRGAITRPAADIVRNVITDPGSDGGFGDGGTNPSGASFASPTEALAWNQAGLEHGYYGTVDDAADAARGGNQAAINTLQSFIATGPTGIVETPGLIGLGIDAITDVREDRTNINTALGALSDTGDLYSDPGGTNSSGYFGDDVQTQQTVSDVDATSTYGDWSGWSDDNNDSDNNDGGWGGQAAADDDYGTVDDFGGAGPDVGGDSGGGGGDGSYCCTASVKQKVMSNKELYALHKWHHSQDSWWVNGYDVWGKWVAKNLVSKHKYFAHLTKAFYNWKVNGKFTAKAAQAAVIIYPGVVIASLLKKQSPQKLAQS